MEVFPELYTKRLKLRRIQIEDAPSLVKYANNKKISGHILNMPYPYQEPQAVFRVSYVVQGFKNKTRYVFYNIIKQEFIGEISLHLEGQQGMAQLGYWLGEPFWGKGIATEAAEAVLKFGFEKLNLKLIFATCHVENKGSEKVLLKNDLKKQSVNGNVMLYSLTKEEFEEHK
jgi:RimJ/RimL family protein N-acetyltransferase